ncbi:MAG: MFS transporter [Thermoleophilia bacterium]
MSTFSSLKIRNYRLYFIGQGISLSGTWMQSIGQAWLVLTLTSSGTSLGLVVALQFLPVLLLAPLGGVIADRFSKRRILFITQSAAATLALVLAVLVATGEIRLWMIYILATFYGLTNTVDNPTRQSFVMELAGRDSLRNAVTLNSMEINLTRVIGPAIAGVLIAGIGFAPCFFINSASFVAVLICLFLMRGEELHRTEPVRRMKGQLRQGFSYIRQTPLLRDVLIMMAIIGTLTYEFQVSLPLIAKFTFHGSANGYALLTSAMGIGAVLGGLVIAGRSRTSPWGLVGASLAFGITIVLVSLSPSLPVALAAMVLVGASSIGFTSLCNATLQLESEPQMRSRVMSLWTVAFLGSTPVGSPIIGWVGEYAGPRWAMAVGGLAALAAAAYGFFALRRRPYPDSSVAGDADMPRAARNADGAGDATANPR